MQKVQNKSRRVSLSSSPSNAHKQGPSTLIHKKAPLSPASVNQWNKMDPQMFDPLFAKQMVSMY